MTATLPDEPDATIAVRVDRLPPAKVKGDRAVKADLKHLPKKQRPKLKCCTSKPKCKRCPLAMHKKGTLPTGFTVRKRRLVRIPPVSDAA